MRDVSRLAIGTLGIAAVGVVLLAAFFWAAGGSLPDRSGSAEILIDVSVVGWEPATSDTEVHLLPRLTVAPFWAVTLNVDRVVHGTLPYEKVNLLVHSPSQFGVRAEGDEFRLALRRVAAGIEHPRILTRSGKIPFAIAAPSYELVSAQTADGAPAIPN